MRSFLIGVVSAIALVLAGLFVLFLFVAHPYARAQTASAPASSPWTPYRCAPKTSLSPTACGTPYRDVRTEFGQCEVWWSQDAPATWNIERRCCLTKYCGTTGDPIAAAKAIANHASGVVAGINEALIRWGVMPATPLEAYQWAKLKWDACEDARTNVALMVQPAASAPVPPADWCGPQPVPAAPPAPSTTTYAVTGTQAFPLNADGSRSFVPIAAKPMLGSTCDCAAKEIIQYGARFCAVTIPGVQQIVVAGCSVKR